MVKLQRMEQRHEIAEGKPPKETVIRRSLQDLLRPGA